MMNRKNQAIALSFPLALALISSGCATAIQSIGLGAALGGTAGGLVGNAQYPNLRSTALGGAIGAGIGGLLGYLGYRGSQAKAAQQAAAPKAEKDSSFPSLTKPKLRSIWVPDRIEGNKFIKGHFIYVIEDPGSWSR